MARVLEAVYEEDFLGFSYGFRPGRGQHDALDAVHVMIERRKVNWVLDVDIRNFFDTIDHDKLMEIVEKRIADPRVLRLLRKWLNAGITEGGEWSSVGAGTPQGAVISPLLANIYLHEALDRWVHEWRKTEARGEVYIVRYADDAVLGFQRDEDARRLLDALRERLEEYGLTLHPEKTRLIEFDRFATENRARRGEGKPETFDFLGFTHACGRRRRDGRFMLKRISMTRRASRTVRAVKASLWERLHEPVAALGRWLRQVVEGYIQYHGVPGNIRALQAFRNRVKRAWYRALRRRSQKKGRRLRWASFDRMAESWLPRARIVHPYPNVRFRV